MCATWKREMNMAAKSIHKVVRLQLAWLYDEQNHFRYPYQKLHDLQQMVNQVKNRTIQAFWEWSNMEVAFKRKQDSIPSYKEYTDGMSMDGYIYRILKEEYPQMYSANLSCSIRCAGKAFRNAKAAMLRGEQSVISYRADAPIELHNGHICLYQEKQRYYVSLHLFSKAFAKEQRAFMTKKLRETIKARDNYTCCTCGNSTYVEPNLLLEIDHIIPIAKGGLTEESNLQTLCWKCNRSKSDKIL